MKLNQWIPFAISCMLAMSAGAAQDKDLAVGKAAASLPQTIQTAAQEALDILEKNALPLPPEAARAAILKALIQAGDPAAEFVNGAEVKRVQDKHAGQVFQTGLRVEGTNGLPTVAEVKKDSPAAQAGIQAGERLERIGERPLVSGDEPEAVARWLRQGEEAGLLLVVQDAAAKTRSVTVQRVRARLDTIEKKEDLPVGMAYLKVNGLYQGSGAEIATVLKGWEESKRFGAVLDLRGAAGTDLASVKEVAELLADNNAMLFALRDPQGQDLEVVKAGQSTRMQLPLMVLCDEETTGAAAALAAVLAGSVRGVMIIGRDTNGDLSLRTPVKVAGDEYVLLATRRLATADGKLYGGKEGVKPDVLITEAALNEVVYEPEVLPLRKDKTLSEEEKEDKELRDRIRSDVYLRRAVDVLLGLKALNYRGD